MAHPNPQNLRVPTSEQARINGAKGGKASAKAKKERKTLREHLEILMQLPVRTDGPQLDDLDEDVKARIQADGMTYADLINIAMMKEASKGNVRAMEYVRDQLGQKPIEKTEVKIEGDIDLQQADIDDLLKSVKKLKK